jgi:hypothetical protein
MRYTRLTVPFLVIFFSLSGDNEEEGWLLSNIHVCFVFVVPERPPIIIGDLNGEWRLCLMTHVTSGSPKA